MEKERPADVLSRIAAHTKKRVERFKKERPVPALRAEPLYARRPQDFAYAFSGPFPRVIAEVKFASPSEGFLRKEEPSAAAACRVAASYLSRGAAALSILTERNFFGGAPEFLAAVRRENPRALLLMKDFLIDPYQLELARASGADCVLLIAALLKDGLKPMLDAACGLGLTALVEVHDQPELDAARAAGAKVVGVNSRNLRTLKTDLEVARSLGRAAKGVDALVAESGIRTPADLRDLRGYGYGGFLVGSALMKAQDPGQALAELMAV